MRPGRRAALQRLAGLAGLAAAGAAGTGRASTPTATDAALSFIALGDMPYGPDLIAGPAYRQLIDQVNHLGLPLTLHVGDFKTGNSGCDDDEYQRQWRHFQRFAGALVFTPGDNDWLDCQRSGHDPLERLQALRQRFFSGPQSLGRQPLPLQRQSLLMPAHPYPENQRWVMGGVVFATFHTVGPRNGMEDASAAVRDEARAREAANSAWIAQAFDLAADTRAPALVLATQAESLVDPWHGRRDRGRVHQAFPSIGQTLLARAGTAPHPVLLVHGDHHRYTTDQPFVWAPTGGPARPLTRLWRLQVFGAPQVHAVRVQVQPEVQDQPFAFSPVWNPMASDPRRHARPGP